MRAGACGGSLASHDSCFQDCFNEVPADAVRKLSSTLPIPIIRVNRGRHTQPQQQTATAAPCTGPANPQGRRGGWRERGGEGGEQARDGKEERKV